MLPVSINDFFLKCDRNKMGNTGRLNKKIFVNGIL
jgi:hypothetical protein